MLVLLMPDNALSCDALIAYVPSSSSTADWDPQWESLLPLLSPYLFAPTSLLLQSMPCNSYIFRHLKINCVLWVILITIFDWFSIIKKRQVRSKCRWQWILSVIINCHLFTFPNLMLANSHKYGARTIFHTPLSIVSIFVFRILCQLYPCKFCEKSWLKAHNIFWLSSIGASSSAALPR